MLTNISQEFRKFSRNCYALRVVLKDTVSALEDIQRSTPLADLRQNGKTSEKLESLQNVLDYCPAFVVLGQTCHSKALFVNYLLGQELLPLHSSNWRWIKLSYGHTKEISLTLGQEFEIVEKLKAHEKPWTTVPECDLLRNDHESLTDHCPAIEIKLNTSLLKDKANIIIPPDCNSDQTLEVLEKGLENILPVIVYVISDETLNDRNVQEIRKIRDTYQEFSILFVSMSENDPSVATESLTESEQHLLELELDDKQNSFNKSNNNKNLYPIKDQLIRLGYINETEVSNKESRVEESFCSQCSVGSTLISDSDFQDKFVIFVNCMLKSYLMKLATSLSELHNNCLRHFILTAFDMAREIQITPRRIKYAQATEGELYRALMRLAGENQEEITRIIQATLQDMKSNVAEVLEGFYYKDEANNLRQPSMKQVSMEIQQVVLHKLGTAVATQLVKSVGILHESFTGTLQRCLENLEKKCHEHEGNLLASDAVKQIITAAYNVELKSSTSFSLVNSFMERLRKFLHGFQMPWSGCSQSKCDLHWQLQIVSNMLDSLSSSKLARNISLQFQEHVKSSHDAFQSAMRALENQLSGKLEQTEEQRILIRKQHAPRFARLALESTSLCDYVRYGMPKLGREIGRGQYGVVYSSETWGGVNPCAIKSIVPPDDRHWNDLAMEFYYTRTIPEHPRIVKLRGSVIDHQYGGGCSAAVLLVMERMTRDLYCGLKAGLSWQKRLQIAIDVVEGIRYLHSQGLVHRDIKLKNVLLDTEDRAKLTDFGFCIPEAMMSGSIVGTPVHMAPELLSGHYDSSVDVYAFGILFWYICANQVRLPLLFEQFQNKEQLWTSVRKGVRPECLPHFPDVCWQLMEQCWAGEPSSRPLLGYVQPQLEMIQRSIPEETTPPDP